MKTTLKARLGLIVAGAALIGVAAPALAQSDEEIIVSGRYGTLPDSVQSASQSVGYADLDLSTMDGRAELKRRLNLTARYLCNKLGESDTSSSVAPTCRDAAVKDAMSRMGTIEAHAVPRGKGWVAPPAWSAPYPADWVERYPG